MSDVTSQQTLALAAICQCCHLVQNLARKGQIESQQLTVMLNSILITDPDSTPDVFDGEHNLKLGYELVHDQLGHKTHKKDSELTAYVLALLALERKLSANKLGLQKIGKEIENAQRQLAHFEIVSDPVVANLAHIYKDVVSPLGAKIQIMGNATLLKNAQTQNKIRAILLAGIRAAVLWRQLGGKRRNILFRRQKWIAFSTQALNRINAD